MPRLRPFSGPAQALLLGTLAIVCCFDVSASVDDCRLASATCLNGVTCLNGGECVDGVNSYSCNCPAGFSGTRCETDNSDCAPNPCLNGGTCVDGANGYTCSCVPGYAGPTCATGPVDEGFKMEVINVLGTALAPCSYEPLTGYFRDGFCKTDKTDTGSHLVCARVTAEFLEFSKARGNDLTTPRPRSRFAGLQPGDRWCLCATRWTQALAAGVAPPVVLDSTHAAALRFVAMEPLENHRLGIVTQ
jgi:uncharacterized protein (DUF2237 family)